MNITAALMQFGGDNLKLSKLAKYLLFTFTVTWVIAMIGCSAFNSGTASGKSFFHHALALSMFIPTVGALFAKADIKGMGWNPRIEKNWKFMLIA